MENSNKRGYITELLVLSKLLEYGDISIPYGNNSRYDCILDFKRTLLRIQIKTAKELSDNKFFVPMCNTQTNRNVCKKKKYSPQDVDFVATIYKNLVYLVPVTKLSTGITLTISNKINNLIHIAEPYKIENILK